MDYKEAVKYIENKNKLGSVPGLDNVKELLLRLGNPESRCRCLHIAGTNGKGSVFAYVQAILMDAGYSVGRYVSPTVMGYLERFQIDGKNIDENDFAMLLTEVSRKVTEMVNDGFCSPTSFEIETAVVFLFFERQKVDYALIECGMGGELDATNVLEHPLVSVISPVGMDHMNILGDTLEEIAGQKAGIIKKGSICVSAPQEDDAGRVIRQSCAKKGAELKMVDERDLVLVHAELEKTEFVYKNNTYTISMLGEHQVINAATAIETAACIPGISEDNIRRGLINTTWLGRLTRVHDKPLMLVDGAHNVPAWKMLKKAVNKYFTNRRIIYIIGVLRDKEYTRLADILGDTMQYVIAITPDSPRALHKSVLSELIREVVGCPVDTACSSDDAVRKAMRAAGENDVILVCGSLSFISDYLSVDRIEGIYVSIMDNE